MRKLIAIALATIALPVLVQPAEANPAAVQAAIGACTANPYACAVVGAAAGTWVLWKNAPSVFCTTYCREMRISNPDEPYHGQIIDYVWGDSPEQAAQRCQQIAAQNGLRYVTVRRTSQKGSKWECHVDNL